MRDWRLLCHTILWLIVLTSCNVPAAEISQEQLQAWGVPQSLPDIIEHIELLQFPSNVDNIDWLPDNIQVLILRESSLHTINRLPRDLRSLDLENSTHITKLPSRIPGLKSLNLKNVSLLDYSNLPENLITLGIGIDSAQGSVEKLPSRLKDKIKCLYLYQTELFGLDTFSSLEQLILHGDSFTSMTLLPRIQHLTLDNTRHTTLDNLPNSIVRLQLLDIRTLSFVDLQLPNYLEFLFVRHAVGRLVRISTALPQSLQDLSLTNGEYVVARELPYNLRSLNLLPNSTVTFGGQRSFVTEIAATPEQLQKLQAGTLPPTEKLSISIEASNALDIVQYSKVTEYLHLVEYETSGSQGPSTLSFPTETWPKLRTLNLNETSGITALGKLPENLKVLALVNSGLRTLPKIPDSVHTLDLRHTRISALEFGENSSLHTLLITQGSDLDLKKLPASLRRLYILDSRPGNQSLWSHFRQLTASTPYTHYNQESMTPECQSK